MGLPSVLGAGWGGPVLVITLDEACLKNSSDVAQEMQYDVQPVPHVLKGVLLQMPRRLQGKLPWSLQNIDGTTLPFYPLCMV
jgi:hypothetical protein